MQRTTPGRKLKNGQTPEPLTQDRILNLLSKLRKGKLSMLLEAFRSTRPGYSMEKLLDLSSAPAPLKAAARADKDLRLLLSMLEAHGMAITCYLPPKKTRWDGKRDEYEKLRKECLTEDQSVGDLWCMLSQFHTFKKQFIQVWDIELKKRSPKLRGYVPGAIESSFRTVIDFLESERWQKREKALKMQKRLEGRMPGQPPKLVPWMALYTWLSLRPHVETLKEATAIIDKRFRLGRDAAWPASPSGSDTERSLYTLLKKI